MTKPLWLHIVLPALVLTLSTPWAQGTIRTKKMGPSRQFGVGIILLGPSGLSANYRFGRGSLDFAAAWNTNPGMNMYLHSTYLFRYPAGLVIDKIPILLYWGAGGRVYTEPKAENRTNTGRTFFGVRAAGGASYLARSMPVEFFGEGSLTLNLSPGTSTEGGVGLGLRYYF